MQSVMMPDGVPVQFRGKTYHLKQVSLRQIKSFLQKVASIFALAEIETMLASADGMARAVERLQEVPETLADLVEIASGIPREEALEGNLEEAVALVFKAIEVNNAVKILSSAIKKARAPQTESGAPEGQSTTPSTEP